LRNKWNENEIVDSIDILESVLDDSLDALKKMGDAIVVFKGQQPELELEKNKIFSVIWNKKDSASRILSDFKQLLKAEEIKPSEFQLTDLGSIINDVLKTVKLPKEIEIAVEIPQRIHLMLKPSSIKELLIHLINNATQAILKNGKILVKCYEKDGRVLIEIQDTGVGISKDNLSKLFKNRFTTKKEGTGLGLFVCDSIAKAHNGFLFAESQEKKGTTFTVVLPKI